MKNECLKWMKLGLFSFRKFSFFFLNHYSFKGNIFEIDPDLEDSVSPSQNEIISGINKIEFPCLDASLIASASESSVVRVDDE